MNKHPHNRLTADVVTGKLDVRPAAAKLLQLPAQPAADELIENLDEMSDRDKNETELI